MTILFIVITFYIIGSIPFGFIVTKLKTGQDIRDYGSKSIGASNVTRLIGIGYGLLIVFLDAMKAILPLFVMKYNVVHEQIDILLCIAALSVTLGHIYSIFLKFKGGKGVATFIGVMAILLPFETLIFLALYVILLITTKYTSVSSLASLFIFPAIIYVSKGISAVSLPYIFLSLLLFFIILLKHRQNIVRLRQGQEPQFSIKQKLEKIYAK